MSSKKKLIISLSAVCLVAVIAVVAVVAVLAAGTQAVTSSITVTYRASMVDATVSAQYYITDAAGTVKEGTPISFKNGNQDILKFEAGAASSTGTLSVDSVALDSVNQTIIFEYKFTCDSANNGYTGELTIPTEGKTVRNFTAEQFYVSDTKVASNALKDIDFQAENEGFSLEAKASAEAASTEKYVYIKVSIADTNADADYIAAFDWALNGVANA